MHHFGVARSMRADIFIGRVLERAAHVAHGGIDHARHLFEVLLRTPEAPRPESRLGEGRLLLRHFLARRDKNQRG